MVNVRGKDKGKRKQRSKLTDDQKNKRSKMIAASKKAKAKKNSADNVKKSNVARRRLIGMIGGKKSNDSTENMHVEPVSKVQENKSDGQASGNVDNLKTPEEEETGLNAGDADGDDSLPENNNSDGKEDVSLFVEGPAPTAKDIINDLPELDVDDEEDSAESDPIEDEDTEPMISEDADLSSNNSDKWGDKPKVGVQQRVDWRV